MLACVGVCWRVLACVGVCRRVSACIGRLGSTSLCNLVSGVYNRYTTKKNTCTKAKSSCQPGTNLYAIVLAWPSTETLLLSDVMPSKGTTVTLLGYKGDDIKWTKAASKGGLTLQLPIIPFNQMPCEWAWTFKITKVI